MPVDQMPSVFAHLILDVQNVQRSIGFYRDCLGFTLCRVEECDGHLLAYILAGDFELLLLQQPPGYDKKALQRGGGVVLNFRVKNLTEIAQNLKKDFVQVLRDLEVPPFGEKTLLVADPDGYAILLSEPVGTYH